MINILQGSAVTQTVLGGLNISPSCSNSDGARLYAKNYDS